MGYKVVNTTKKYRRRRAATCTALALVVGGASGSLSERLLERSVRAETSPANEAPLTPVAQSDTLSLQTPDTCTETEQVPVSSIFDYYVESRIAEDASFDELEVLDRSSMSDVEADQATDGVYQRILGELDITYTVARSPDDLPDSASDPEDYQPTSSYVLGHYAILGTGYLPPEMLKDLDIRFTLVDSIDSDKTHEHLGGADGQHANFWEEDEDFQEILVDDMAVPSTYVHEIGHGLHRELCDMGSRFNSVVEQLQKSGERIPYIEDTNLDPAYWLSIPTPHRQFSRGHGAQTSREDWASIVTDTLMSRVVMPGDDDWRSPYQQVQYAIIADIEAKYPGFTEHVLKMDTFYRVSPKGDYNHYLAEECLDDHWMRFSKDSLPPDDFDQMFAEARLGSGQLIYLNNMTVVYDFAADNKNSELRAIYIDDPILTWGPDGDLYLVSVNPISLHSEGFPTFTLLPYDPRGMTILATETSSVRQTTAIDVVTTTDDGRVLINGAEVATQTYSPTSDGTILNDYTDLLATGKVLRPTDFMDLVLNTQSS